jgi:DDE superfamily endonuclease
VSHQFYTRYVKQPTATTPLPPHIAEDPKCIPYFKDAIGAIDGVHTLVSPLESERARCRNRKGQLSLNHLAACNFDMQFTYVLSGWEGSVADGFLFTEAIQNQGLSIPGGRFYLADAGFAATEGLLVPFRGVRYHLREWARGSEKPQTRNELYNLRHSSYRNVVERIFGVMKRRWRIILETNSFSLQTNAKVMSALAALHNFIRRHDRDDEMEPWDEDEEEDDDAVADGRQLGSDTTIARSTVIRERIADAMWRDYQDVLETRRVSRRTQARCRREIVRLQQRA